MKDFKLPDLGEGVRPIPPPCKGGGEGVGGAHCFDRAPDDAECSTHPLTPSLKGRGETHTLHRIRPAIRQLAAKNCLQPTHPERTLWSLLRKSQLGGLKFRRQAVIGPYIVDFCCPLLKLIVEVDGLSHVGRASADARRAQILQAHGYRVLRVTNDDVLKDVEAVGLAILREAGIDAGAPTLRSAPHPPPSPLPHREGETR